MRAIAAAVLGVLIGSTSHGELFAQARNGAIYGTVAADGQPIAGATITVIGTESPYIGTSDDRGQFRLLSLPPGAYRIEIVARGYWPAVHEGLVVSVGQSTTVDAQLIPAVEQVQVVAPEPSSLESRQVTTGSTLDQAELEQLPTARDIWEAARLAPGILVDRVNIAGNESTEPSAISGPGYSMTQQAWSIDGVNITDSTTPDMAGALYSEPARQIRSKRRTASSARDRVGLPGDERHLQG